jgi:hypothetical protein
MNYKITVRTLEERHFSSEFFDYEQVHHTLFNDTDFIRIEGTNEAEEVFYIPKMNIDFIKVEEI